MFRLFWQKPLKVSKRDTYTIDVANWSSSEDVLTLTTTTLNGLVTVVANVIGTNSTGKTSVVGVTVIGLAEGVETVTLNYSTATRSDSVEVDLKVGDACLIH